MDRAADLLREAQALAKDTSTWADLSNALFDPIEGLLACAYPTGQERQEFIKSEEFKRIQDLLAQSRKRHGLLEGATPQRVTAFMVHFHLNQPANGNEVPRNSFDVAPSEQG